MNAPLSDLRERLLALADEDTAAFDRLMAAFRLPKGSDEEKAARRAAIQAATRDATTVPLQTAVVCARALDLIVTIAALGNPSASSDLLVAMGVLRAGAEGAAANVRTNLGGLDDDDLQERRLDADLRRARRGRHPHPRRHRGASRLTARATLTA